MWFYVVIIKMNKIDKIEEKGYNRIGNTLWNDLLHIRSAASTRLIVSSADEGTTSFLPSKNSVRSPGERNRANFYLPVNQASEILPELLGSPTITGVSGENNFCLNAWRDRSVEEWKGLGRATKELRGTRGGSKVLVETVESWRSIAAYEERNLWQFGETLCDLFREIVLCALHLPDTVGYYRQEGVRVCTFSTIDYDLSPTARIMHTYPCFNSSLMKKLWITVIWPLSSSLSYGIRDRFHRFQKFWIFMKLYSCKYLWKENENLRVKTRSENWERCAV